MPLYPCSPLPTIPEAESSGMHRGNVVAIASFTVPTTKRQQSPALLAAAVLQPLLRAQREPKPSNSLRLLSGSDGIICFGFYTEQWVEELLQHP